MTVRDVKNHYVLRVLVGARLWASIKIAHEINRGEGWYARRADVSLALNRMKRRGWVICDRGLWSVTDAGRDGLAAYEAAAEAVRALR